MSDSCEIVLGAREEALDRAHKDKEELRLRIHKIEAILDNAVAKAHNEVVREALLDLIQEIRKEN